MLGCESWHVVCCVCCARVCVHLSACACVHECVYVCLWLGVLYIIQMLFVAYVLGAVIHLASGVTTNGMDAGWRQGDGVLP